jgi:hypothetical protein
MATTDHNAVFDFHFIKEFAKYTPKQIRKDLMMLSDSTIMSGIIQRDRMMEFACAEQGYGYEVDSKDEADFSNGDDMKTVTVNYRPSAPEGKIIITGVQNKIGSLRVVALDPKTAKFRYFVIWDYEAVREYGRIEFGFKSPKSKYINGECGMELDSFQELAMWENNKINGESIDE